MPVTPTLWSYHLKSGVRDQPGQHGKTLSLLKIQKISQAWWHAPVIPATREAEAGELLEEVEIAVSRDCAIVLQPRGRELNCLRKKNKIHIPIEIIFHF